MSKEEIMYNNLPFMAIEVHGSSIKDAMDEWSKQQSIDFMHFYLKSGWYMSFHGTWYKPTKLTEPNITTEQLYDLFLQSQNNIQ